MAQYYLPGFNQEYVEKLGWTKAQLVTYLLLDYTVIFLYAVLLALALRNVWLILVKQREYRNLPILMFYIFAFIALTLRLVFLLGQWTRNPMFQNMGMIQQFAKLSVGVVQDWITLELAIRIRNARGYEDISEAAIRKLRMTRLVLFIIVSLTFVALTIAVFVSAYNTSNETYAFGD